MDLTQLINHPELMSKETLYDLRSMVALYPYYQTARLLMLQNLYLLHDSSFDDELRRAAVFVTDRTKLFNLVEASHYKPRTAEKSHTDNAKPPMVNNDTTNGRTLSLIDNFLDSMPETDNTVDGEKRRKPTPADAAIDYVSYLIETEKEQPTSESASKTAPKLKGQALIDDFINDGGKITLQDKPEYVPQIDNGQKNADTTADDSFFTETLAKIYIKQGRYSKALEIIKRLNLNYPKKNAYFADQIRFLEKLIVNSNAKGAAAKQKGSI